MKRKYKLMCAGSGILLSLLLIYSLIVAMTGIYACPLEAHLDGSHCYLVKCGEAWCLVNMRGNLGDQVNPLPVDQFEVRAGWWTATAVSRSNGYRSRAFAPYNLVDIADLVFGSRRDLGR